VKAYYEQDGITIYHGDCRDVLPLACDVIVSDPPYAMAVDTGKLQRIGKPEYKWHGVEHSGGVAVELLLSMRKPTVLFGANGYASRLSDHPGWIVWDKQADGFAQGSPAELAWSNYLTNLRMFRLNYRGFTTRDDPKGHPMQKPLALMRWILTLKETPDGTVLDPYMGSGSTLVAAKQCGRQAIGVEIEERYCEIAAARLSQVSPDMFSGQVQGATHLTAATHNGQQQSIF
jgi:DNA modification methylase